MKITLEFDGIEEKQEAEIALNAYSYYRAITEFSRALYRINKHEEIIPDKYYDIITALWEEHTEDLKVS